VHFNILYNIVALHIGTEEYRGPNPAARKEEAKGNVNLTAKRRISRPPSLLQNAAQFKVVING
jgi:hypothetical protein